MYIKNVIPSPTRREQEAANFCGIELPPRKY